MRQLEKFKETLAALDDPMEAALYIDKMREAAGYFCKERYPDEVILETDSFRIFRHTESNDISNQRSISGRE